ncbi:putative zinc finger protein [Orchesella cincta]|uniref:Putative zinc finger protein n=1 Tax=Orchesella cincta TaxID=48709 RepID=A0A1D2MJK9_ORCCI|nr:putative zinc finger protein [Orchesella cincta]
MANMEYVISSDTFICKSRLCVICTKMIGDHPSTLNLSPESFLKGVYVLCDVLQLEPRFASEELWRFAGVDNFVNFICCAQCSDLLTNLVSLHELIVAKKASLERDVRQIENIILETCGHAEEIEFSVNTCASFRNEVLKNYQFRAASDSSNYKCNEDVSVPILIPEFLTAQASINQTSINDEPKAKRSKRITSKPRSKQEQVTNDRSIPGCFVYLEKLENLDVKPKPSELAPAVDPLATLSGGGAHDNEDDANYEPTFQSPEQSSDEDFVPETKHYKEKRSAKKRGRGRPRKHSLTDDSATLTVPPLTKRKRGRPSTKTNAITEKPARVKKEKVKLIKKRGRPRRDVTEDKYLHDGPNFKPILVLETTPGEFMFMHVKFKQENRSLLCQHPNCTYCIDFGTCFSEQDAYKRIRFHIRHEHRNHYVSAVEKKFYCCYYCDSQFPNRQPLLEHVRKEHGEAPVETLCEICCCTLPQANLVKHIFTHKNDDEKAIALANRSVKRRGKTKDQTLPSGYPCDQCNKLVHESINAILYFINFQIWKSYTELRLHRITHVPIEMRRQFHCHICPSRLTSLHALKSHIEHVHNKDATPAAYECKYCGRRYNKSQKTKYDIHLRQHTGEKPYQCSRCIKAFASREQLNRHEIIHAGMQIQCEFCSSVYKTPKYLRRHHLKHHPDLVQRKVVLVEPAKPQIPQEYEEGFIGPRLSFPCEPCNKVFIFKSQLITHMKHRHKLELPKNEDYPNQNIIDDEEVKPEVSNNRNAVAGSGNFATPFYMPSYGY